jgi:hypothetical protein
MHKSLKWRIRQWSWGLSLAVVLAATMPMTAFSATLSVAPTSGLPGATISIRGDGFSRSDDRDCRVLFDDDAQLSPLDQGGDGTPAINVGSCHITGSGGVRGEFIVPQRPPGQFFVAVCNDCAGDTPEMAVASFAVLPSQATTSSTTSTTTTTSVPTPTSSTTSTTVATTSTTSTTTSGGSASASSSITSTTTSPTSSVGGITNPLSTQASTTLDPGGAGAASRLSQSSESPDRPASVLGKTVQPAALAQVGSSGEAILDGRQIQIWAAMALVFALLLALVRWLYLQYWKYR